MEEIKGDCEPRDFLNVSLTRDNEWNLREKYKLFGWTETEIKDDSLYSNVVHVSYYRPHFIDNKDDLQLLQVRMESEINNLSKADMYKHLRSALACSLVAIMAILLVAAAVVAPLVNLTALHIAVCSFCGLCAVLCLIFGIMWVINIRRNENQKFFNLRERTSESITAICIRAELLSGVKNEEEIS